MALTLNYGSSEASRKLLGDGSVNGVLLDNRLRENFVSKEKLGKLDFILIKNMYASRVPSIV